MSTPAIPLPELPGVRHRDVDAGGLRMHVAELGPSDAPPLLLVHGWPQHWWCWHEVAPLLASDFRCVMPDLRGHGWSQAPRGGYEKERLADDLLNLLDALGLERVGYVGHDWGAYTGFLLGMRAPERLSGFLALSIPHPWPSRHDRLNPARLAAFAYQIPLSTPIVGQRLMRTGLTRRVLQTAATRGTFSDADVRIYDSVMRSPQGARVTVAMYRTFLLREMPGVIAGRYGKARLPIPTRLVVGDEDPIVRGAELDGYEGNAPEMTVTRVPRARHFLPEEQPDAVAGHVRELFASAQRA
jgi:pimeloyl-ACP methyl ester carboxylesterase